MHAAELVHIQFNEATGDVQVINNMPEPVHGCCCARCRLQPRRLARRTSTRPNSPPRPTWPPISVPIDFPATVSPVHFIKLDLRDAAGKLLSTNFYWRAQPAHPDDLTALNQLPMVTLTRKCDTCERRRQMANADSGSRCTIQRRASR